MRQRNLGGQNVLRVEGIWSHCMAGRWGGGTFANMFKVYCKPMRDNKLGNMIVMLRENIITLFIRMCVFPVYFTLYSSVLL